MIYDYYGKIFKMRFKQFKLTETVTSDLCSSFSDLMGALSRMLNVTEQTIVQVEDQDSAAESKLESMMSDAQKLERTVQDLLDQVEFIKNSDVRGKRRSLVSKGWRFKTTVNVFHIIIFHMKLTASAPINKRLAPKHGLRSRF